MARQRGRPREQPQDLVYLRLAVTPEEHRQIKVAAALADVSMAQFARRAVAVAARAKIVEGGIDPMRLPEPAGGDGGEVGGASSGEGEVAGGQGDTRKGRGRKKG